MNIEQQILERGIIPGKLPATVKSITDDLNGLTDNFTFSSKGVGRWLKANGFQRTVRVIDGKHSVCYCIDQAI